MELFHCRDVCGSQRMDAVIFRRAAEAISADEIKSLLRACGERRPGGE